MVKKHSAKKSLTHKELSLPKGKRTLKKLNDAKSRYETSQETAIRECLEETGQDITEFILEYHILSINHLKFFIAATNFSHTQLMLPPNNGETKALHWIPLETFKSFAKKDNTPGQTVVTATLPMKNLSTTTTQLHGSFCSFSNIQTSFLPQDTKDIVLALLLDSTLKYALCIKSGEQSNLSNLPWVKRESSESPGITAIRACKKTIQGTAIRSITECFLTGLYTAHQSQILSEDENIFIMVINKFDNPEKADWVKLEEILCGDTIKTINTLCLSNITKLVSKTLHDDPSILEKKPQIVPEEVLPSAADAIAPEILPSATDVIPKPKTVQFAAASSIQNLNSSSNNPHSSSNLPQLVATDRHNTPQVLNTNATPFHPTRSCTPSSNNIRLSSNLPQLVAADRQNLLPQLTSPINPTPFYALLPTNCHNTPQNLNTNPTNSSAQTTRSPQ